MPAALLSTSQEISMLTRRIAVSACALCLAVPAAAGAQSNHGAVTPMGPYRAAQVASVQGAVTPMGPYRAAKVASVHGAVTPMGPYRAAKVAGVEGAVTPMGPYRAAKVASVQGAVTPMGPYVATKATGPAQAAVTSDGNGTDGWRIAAVIEAALFAALALGSVLILRARRVAPRMGM
jgi:hypothetical protein